MTTIRTVHRKSAEMTPLVHNFDWNLKPDLMTPSFTTLALNLLISEREYQRHFFLEKIMDSKPLHKIFSRSPEFKQKFLSVMLACVENPSSTAAAEFYEFARFCDEEVTGNTITSAA